MVRERDAGETYSVPRRLHPSTPMVDSLSAGLIALVVALFGLALYALAVGRLTVAGLSFLSASITIYLRETRVRDDGPS